MALILIGSILIVPLALPVGGKLMCSLDGSDPNSVIGFRTKLSMSSQEAWNYANAACGKLWLRTGWILFAASIAAMVIALIALAPKGLQTDSTANTAGVAILAITGVQIAAMLVSIARVQKELQLRFGADDHVG